MITCEPDSLAMNRGRLETNIALLRLEISRINRRRKDGMKRRNVLMAIYKTLKSEMEALS